MSRTVLILAAGLGSRYGGLKQLDPIGPTGETVLEYAVFDALRNGFDRVVFVVRREFETAFRAAIVPRFAGSIAIDLAYQEIGDLPRGFSAPPGRTKPWGTGHAVWCARRLLDGPFAVLNADDFYGHDAFRRLAEFLTATMFATDEVRAARACMVAYRLEGTLSEHGSVSRGVCRVGALGRLVSVVECSAITRRRDGSIIATTPGGERRMTGDEPVSMNCWGFPLEILGPLELEFARFLEEPGHDSTAEFYLPSAVTAMIAQGELQVDVLPAQGEWFGVTFREDRLRVRSALQRLVEAGVYPSRLWPSANASRGGDVLLASDTIDTLRRNALT